MACCGLACCGVAGSEGGDVLLGGFKGLLCWGLGCLGFGFDTRTGVDPGVVEGRVGVRLGVAVAVAADARANGGTEPSAEVVSVVGRTRFFFFGFFSRPGAPVAMPVAPAPTVPFSSADAPAPDVYTDGSRRSR